MGRLARVELIGYPQHVVQRGHNRAPCFADAQDYRRYLTYLRESSRRYGCDIHAYVLMTNHVHLLLSPQKNHAIRRTMQRVGRM